MATKHLFLFTKTGNIKHGFVSSVNNSYVNVRRKHYDIAIAGGGMVGNAMACALAKNSILQNKKVVLFEAASHKPIKKKSVNDEYSNRVVSLNPGTRKFLESIGAWKFINDARFRTVKGLQVWDACSNALITLKADENEDVSYIVENDVVLYALEEVLKNAENKIDVEYQAKIKNIQLPDEDKLVKLEMENSDNHTCKLLIGAEGANSPTRNVLNTRYLSWSYNQMGIVATLQLSEPTDNTTAWQRFLPTGPIALLPLTDNLSSLVWSTSTEQAKKLLELSDECFVDAVNDAYWKQYEENSIVNSASTKLNQILEALRLNTGAARELPPNVTTVVPKSRAAFPLGFGHSTRYVTSGVAIIGDAAHRVHPLAGQGVNLGFGDVESLTKLLSDWAYSGGDIGSITPLLQYESERQKHNFPTMVAIDGLQKLYGTDFTPVVLVRSLGLQITQSLTPVKKAIMKFASV